MSLVSLPDISVPQIDARQRFELPAGAVEAWDLGLTARSTQRVISIVEPIGNFGEGRGVTPARIQADLDAAGNVPVTVQINSPGGNCADGIAIFNLLRAHPYAVTVQVLGIAASAASIIAMAGDEIEMGQSASIMIHNCSCIAFGNRAELMKTINAMQSADEGMREIYVARTGTARNAIVRMMDAETYLNRDRALAMGFATKKLQTEKRDAPAASQSSSARDIAEFLQARGYSTRKAKAAAGAAWRTLQTNPETAADNLAAILTGASDRLARFKGKVP